MPDSGQDHTTDCNDGFLMTTSCFYTSITGGKFRIFLRFDQSICNLHQNWFKIRTSTGNPCGFDFMIALIITWTTSGP